ncbi:MAG: lactate utilization protein C [Deltaproteobacteria bacterium HGW-Deltaproteobacteria-8]|jgi:hypothetical protein|nr:MAG: lactate utilization protein C [Deltaproteobacteria bacterium HGW-Deltaproteobacteria-8]
MDAPVLKQREKLAGHIIQHLGKRKMDGSFAPTAAEAKAQVLRLIGAMKTPTSVIRCGSETVGGLGLWADIAALSGVTLMDPYAPGLSKEQGAEVRRQGLLADVLVASSNAITMDGRLVNLDGTGNRVAGMLFGPKKVILVVGMNKVAQDVAAAQDRVRAYAAPANNMRLGEAYGLKNPCLEDGRCHQCMSETKICNIWTIIEGQAVRGRIHVVLVAEDLGY